MALARTSEKQSMCFFFGSIILNLEVEKHYFKKLGSMILIWELGAVF